MTIPREDDGRAAIEAAPDRRAALIILPTVVIASVMLLAVIALVAGT
ncbi:MAG: hypothetical protein HY678_04250 [Chloroflexi bacterium]|nr:hypothetical protein [Chloroflexota bacterium]